MQEAAAAVEEQTASIAHVSDSSRQVAEYAEQLSSQIGQFKVS